MTTRRFPTAAPVDETVSEAGETAGRPTRVGKLLALGLVLIALAYAASVNPWIKELQLKRASLTVLQEWAARAPKDPLVHYYLGTQYFNRGVLPEALSAFQRAAVLDPKMPRAQVGLAAVRLKLGQLKEAREAAAQAVALDPKAADAYLLLGITTFPESKTQALLEFQKMTRAAPRNAEAWHWQGRCQKELSDFAGALPCMQKAVELDPGNGVYHRDLGGVYLDLGRFEEARSALEQALKLMPQDAETNYLLARNLSTTGGSPEDLLRADGLMARSIELLGEGDPKNTAAVMVERAELLRQLKRPQEAYNLLQTARKLDPAHTRILHFLGLAARSLGRNEEAERLLADYSRISRERTELSNMEQRVKQDDKNPALRLRLARLYERAGNLPFAVNQYEMCLYLQPGNAEAKREREALVKRLKAGEATP